MTHRPYLTQMSIAVDESVSQFNKRFVRNYKKIPSDMITEKQVCTKLALEPLHLMTHNQSHPPTSNLKGFQNEYIKLETPQRSSTDARLWASQERHHRHRV